MKGFDVTENDMGFTAVRLHYSADPTKDPSTPEGEKWHTSVRKLFPDANRWAAEMEVNWWVAQGTRVYPEFAEGYHCRALSHRPRKVIYRAWDFGWHAPVCLIAQIDSQDRLMVLREIVGREETTRQFAQKVIERCTKWYPGHPSGFQDFCDPTGQQVASEASEKSEARDVDILKALGIYPTWEYGWSRKDGRSLVHQLLALRVDDTAGMWVDMQHCPVLVQGFLGKFVYEPKKNGQVHDEPDENMHPWADAQAALRYLVTGLFSALGLRRIKLAAPEPIKVNYHGYGTTKRQR